MDEAETRSYTNVLAYVTRTPWAITDEAFGIVKEVIARRMNGWRPTAEEAAELQKVAAQRSAGARVGAIAVIPLQGMLVPRASMFSAMSGGTSMESFGAALTAAVNDPSVSHIVLDVDSPGGVSDMIPETAALIRAARDVKPVTAVANTEAGSAAYWLASQAGDLSVTPSGSVGSIGVFGIHTDVSAARQNLGIRDTVIKSTASPYKAEFLPLQPLTAEARAAAQQNVDAMCDAFIADVASGRGVPPEHVASTFGQGRMVAAAQAVDRGMADRVETHQAAITRIATGRGQTPAPVALNVMSPADFRRANDLPDLSDGDEPEETETRPLDTEAQTAQIVPERDALISRPEFRAAYSTGR